MDNRDGCPSGAINVGWEKGQPNKADVPGFVADFNETRKTFTVKWKKEGNKRASQVDHKVTHADVLKTLLMKKRPW